MVSVVRGAGRFVRINPACSYFNGGKNGASHWILTSTVYTVSDEQIHIYIIQQYGQNRCDCIHYSRLLYYERLVFHRPKKEYRNIYRKLSAMSRKRGLLLLILLFTGYQWYLHSYVRRIRVQYEAMGAFLQDNFDEISQYFFIIAIFLFLALYIWRVPIITPVYLTRLHRTVATYVVTHCILRGAQAASIFFGIILGIAWLHGLSLDSVLYLSTVYSRLLLYSISSFLIYWAIYLWIEKEVVALVLYLLLQWAFSILIILYNFYNAESVLLLREIRMRYFFLFECTVGLVAFFGIVTGSRREYLSA